MHKNYGLYYLLLTCLITFIIEGYAVLNNYIPRPRIAFVLTISFLIAFIIFFTNIWTTLCHKKKRIIIFLLIILYILAIIVSFALTFAYITSLPNEKEVVIDNQKKLLITSIYEEERYYDNYNLFYIKEH